jgi:hypothetical protein
MLYLVHILRRADGRRHAGHGDDPERRIGEPQSGGRRQPK